MFRKRPFIAGLMAMTLLAGLWGCAGKQTPAERKAFDKRMAVKLLKMRRTDQALRRELSSFEDPSPALEQKIAAADRRHAVQLRLLIKKNGGWPKRSEVGRRGQNAAWIIAQHADERPRLQRYFLKQLTQAVDAGNAPARHEAYLRDKVRLAAGKPQIYGTQVEVKDGEVVLKSVKERSNLDARREEVGLPPWEQYKKQLQSIIDRGKKDSLPNIQ
jgi:hypothetical protein